MEVATQVIDEVRCEATKREVWRLLLDLTQWARPKSEIIRYCAGEHLAKTLHAPFKVAAFANPGDINKFGEDTAVNRGHVSGSLQINSQQSIG